MQKTPKPLYLGRDYQDNLDYFRQELGDGESFDIIFREIRVAGRNAVLICLDGFVKDEVLTEVMQSLFAMKKDLFSTSSSLKLTLEKTIPYIELATEGRIDQLLFYVLSGSILMIVDGLDEAFVIDARTYPSRSPEEPDIERVVRGSRDGFTETLVFNTALLRRRIRDPHLRIELLQIGRRSKSDVALCYINDIANPDMVKQIRDKTRQIDIDAIPMAEKSVEELIVPGTWWNPFPRVRYTERPDVAAVHLLEGHVLVVVDTSPSVIIAPATYFHHVQHAEEYRQNPSVGVYIRWVRFLAIIGSIIVTPLWLLLALSPELLPPSLAFIGPEKTGNVPLLLQFVLAELALDLMRMASIHTPSPLATSLGVIAALLIGDVAVTIGLLAPEVILYTAVVAVGSYSTPSYEMAMANRLVRFFILLATGFFQLYGFLTALIISLLVVVFTRSFGVPYLWPLIPLDFKSLRAILVRSPVPVQNTRPRFLKTLDTMRQATTPAMKKRR